MEPATLTATAGSDGPGEATLRLMEHQRKFVEIARTNPRYGFFADPGCGKTIAVLAAVADAKSRPGGNLKTLVVCPKSIIDAAWMSDARHFTQLHVVSCWGESAIIRKRLIATQGADILIINPDCFKRHVDDFIRAGVGRLVFDESSLLKSPKSQITKTTIAFADRMKSVFLLSGTPAPNNDTEYWGQLRAIQRGIVPDSYWTFCYHYFAPKKKWIQGREFIAGWQPLQSKRDDFLNKLKKVSWSLRKEDALDLPEQIDQVRVFPLSKDERSLYDAVEDKFIRELELEGESVNLQTSNTLMRLRQCCAGGFYDDQKTYRRSGRSKLDELLSVLNELGSHQVVIWAQFSAEIDAIAAELTGKASVVDGRRSLSQRTEGIRRFQAGELQYLVCQPQAAGHGITLTAASYAVYYSLSFSYELYQQSRDRIHRVGQRWPCTYIHLLADGTVDEHIYKSVKTKQSASDVIRAALASRNGEEGHGATEPNGCGEVCQYPF